MKTVKLASEKQYPRVIYFGAEAYKVRFKRDLNCYGITDAGEKTITIKSGLSPRALLETYVHEILHVIEFEAPIPLKHKHVYRLEQAIVQLLMDNFL